MTEVDGQLRWISLPYAIADVYSICNDISLQFLVHSSSICNGILNESHIRTHLVLDLTWEDGLPGYLLILIYCKFHISK